MWDRVGRAKARARRLSCAVAIMLASAWPGLAMAPPQGDFSGQVRAETRSSMGQDLGRLLLEAAAKAGIRDELALSRPEEVEWEGRLRVALELNGRIFFQPAVFRALIAAITASPVVWLDDVRIVLPSRAGSDWAMLGLTVSAPNGRRCDTPNQPGLDVTKMFEWFSLAGDAAAKGPKPVFARWRRAHDLTARFAVEMESHESAGLLRGSLAKTIDASGHHPQPAIFHDYPAFPRYQQWRVVVAGEDFALADLLTLHRQNFVEISHEITITAVAGGNEIARISTRVSTREDLDSLSRDVERRLGEAYWETYYFDHESVRVGVTIDVESTMPLPWLSAVVLDVYAGASQPVMSAHWLQPYVRLSLSMRGVLDHCWIAPFDENGPDASRSAVGVRVRVWALADSRLGDMALVGVEGGRATAFERGRSGRWRHEGSDLGPWLASECAKMSTGPANPSVSFDGEVTGDVVGPVLSGLRSADRPVRWGIRKPFRILGVVSEVRPAEVILCVPGSAAEAGVAARRAGYPESVFSGVQLEPDHVLDVVCGSGSLRTVRVTRVIDARTVECEILESEFDREPGIAVGKLATGFGATR